MADKVIPVKVALRIRPLVEKEINEGCQVALESVDGEPQVFIQNSEKAFTYDYVFGSSIAQEDVYVKAVKGLITKLFSGYNVTVLAYGQTGSGKTHSMGTAYTASDDPDTEGVIPRSVADIFKYIATQSDKTITVNVSFVELYKEQLFDLLSEQKRREDKMVEIREDTKGIKIPGLTCLPVTSVHETFTLLERASGARVTASTAMNSRSSRSHALFTLNITAAPKSDPKNLSTAQFHLVDLAGSERADKTKATGVRLKEGININMGLLGLGNVISALGDPNQGPNHHIPYRDSKLTRLLQDSLGGNSHTLMIACCSPADSNLEETLSTLRYADRARKIKNKPIVNKDPKAAELSRLRSQVQELKMQLLEGGGGGVLAGGSSSSNAALELDNQRLIAENGALTAALQASLNENGHMNEKLMLSEQSNDKLKQKLEELNAEAEHVVDALNKTGDIGQITIMKKLKEHVVQVQNYQKQAEKTMVDHDISRFNQTPAATPDTSMDGSQEGEDEENFGDATHALKQTELANQLNDLNKVLAKKQELAGGMGDNHEKLLALKKQYETALKGMEDEITKLQKEKDSLTVQQRNAGVGAAAVTGGGGPNNKVSEMRRKRIQELEGQILDMRKKQKEQQKLAKINEQNELKVKKLNDDIKQMKVAKVKLIKQMKEDSEKVRQFKITKEKEVHQLKQKDRKQQVTIAKMERLHERQQNVLKRKMEESSAINKRLKDALEKKEAVQKQREGSTKRLEGAGDRVRGWIKSEIEVVVSTKEAETTKDQLIADRKSLASQLQKLKAEMRKTMNQDELETSTKKLEELQTELDYRNAQISELQKQLLISSQETDKSAAADRWTRLTSMVEAKIAAQYLFDTASDYMAQTTARSAEVKDLAAQLDELRDSWDALKKEVRDGNMKHEDQIVRLERDHEEKVLYLLRQLNPVDTSVNKPVEQVSTPDISLSKDITVVEQRLKFQAAELEKYSDLHDELIAKDTEVTKLKNELEVANSAGKLSRGSLMPSLAPSPNKKKSATKRVTIASASYKDADEYFNEVLTDDEDSEEEEEDSDDEWRQTPMFKRLKQERAAVKESRQSLAGPDATKKRRKTLSSDSEDNNSDNSENAPSPTKKLSLGAGLCKCKTGCKTKKCACKKAGPFCSNSCKCDPNKCAHREVPGPDVSSSNDTTNKENMSLSSVSEGETTANLLNGTFDVPTSKAYVSPKKAYVDSPDIFTQSPSKLNFDSPDLFATSPKEARSPLKSIFKKPTQGSPIKKSTHGSPKRSASGSETDTTPTNKKSSGATPKSFFSSPQLK